MTIRQAHTECPKIYGKSILICGILKQMQYRFGVNLGTLSKQTEKRKERKIIVCNLTQQLSYRK